ncbi:MAG TPA: YceI family protein, partial [Solirubrobacterales bacterium]|nr:YceI family protein [Solirubrobacterales bacterium]
PDFFDAERHPQLRFESSELEIAEDGAATIRGELEIRGEKHQVEASGRFAQLGADLGGSRRVGLSLEATVDRRSFGLDWNAELPSGGEVLDYEVGIAVELELVEEAE